MMKRMVYGILCVLAMCGAARAELAGHIEQGGLAIGLAHPGASVSLDGRELPVGPDGHFLVGFGRDAPPQALLVIDGISQSLMIAPRSWPVQRINGLPQRQVSPDPTALARIREENASIVAARRRLDPAPWWQNGLMMPVEGPLSGVFGSQRILNNEPRAPHSGIDIAAPAGTPVRAAGDGVVSLIHPNMVLTGCTVMINHGMGLQTVYAHMTDSSVTQGQQVRRGQVIGHVGQTGRATGPHLHFGVTLFDVKLDPQTVLTVLPPAS